MSFPVSCCQNRPLNEVGKEAQPPWGKALWAEGWQGQHTKAGQAGMSEEEQGPGQLEMGEGRVGQGVPEGRGEASPGPSVPGQREGGPPRTCAGPGLRVCLGGYWRQRAKCEGRPKYRWTEWLREGRMMEKSPEGIAKGARGSNTAEMFFSFRCCWISTNVT